MIAVVKAIEWDNFGLIIIDNSLSYSIVDILFGGRKVAPTLKVEGRPYTSIEQSMVQSIIELLLNDLSSSFEPVSPVTFQLERMETNPRFATIARPEDVALLLSLQVEMESRSGTIELLLPFSTIEPVKKLLAKSFIGERGSKDPTWANHLEEEIFQTKVTIDAAINGKTATIKDVVSLNVGDTIVLDKFANDDIYLRIDGIKISSGKLGKFDDKVAVQLTDDINLERFKL
jgi:flagellar motor switch protein FliM